MHCTGKAGYQAEETNKATRLRSQNFSLMPWASIFFLPPCYLPSSIPPSSARQPGIRSIAIPPETTSRSPSKQNQAMASSSSYELVHQAKSEEHKPYSSKPTERPWRPGMLRQLPWTGLLALLLGFGCGVAALTIALVSNGKPLDYWRVQNYSVQPTVLLAILVTLANVLIGYAFASGITVFWWSSALAGSSLRKLHASQSRGDSLMAVFTSRPIFNAVTILLLMDQPLFQRGIRVVARSSDESTNMRIPISSSPIQRGATGVSLGVEDTEPIEKPSLFHPLYAQVVRQYQNRNPIRIALPLCKGRCNFDVISTGWEVSCIEWQTPYHMIDRLDTLEYQDYQYHQSGIEYTGPPETQLAFSVNITYNVLPYVQIDTSVMYKATTGANGTMHWRNCNLIEALINYPVEVSNDTLRLKAMHPGTNRTIHRIIRDSEDGMGYGTRGTIWFERQTLTCTQVRPSTLGGIWRALEYQFAAQANISSIGWTHVNGIDLQRTSMDTQDAASDMYLNAPGNGVLGLNYDITWSDPTDDIISAAHELTLRTAIATTDTLVVVRNFEEEIETISNSLTQAQPEITSPNLTFVKRTTDQEAKVIMNFEENVYKTQRQWLAGAFAVIVMACSSIFPTYWGWWRLGRPVSMSPLEIAKAFDAPLMQHTDPNGSAADHVRTEGDTKVRYGYHATVAEQLESDTTTERLSYHPKIDSTLTTSAGEQGSNDDDEPNRPSSENGSASNTSIIGSARPDDDIELQMLHPEANRVSLTQSNHASARRSFVSSDAFESVSGIQADSSSGLGTVPASSRIHTRIEMRLKFAEE
jgi:hypothetical protein